MTLASFALNYASGGYDPFGYHILNIAVHIFVVLMIYAFTHRIFSDAGFSSSSGYGVITAGIFGLHPLQSQAVSYLSQRAELLSSFSYILFLLLLIQARESGRTIRGTFFVFLGFIVFIAGFGAKAIIITAPAVFFVYTRFFTSSGDKYRSWSSKSLVFPLAVSAFIIALLAWFHVKALSSSSGTGFSLKGLGVIEYSSAQLRVFLTYLRLIFFPINQNLDYDYPVGRDLGVYSVVISFAAVSVILLVAFLAFVIGRRQMKTEGKGNHFYVISFGILWFFILLIPTSSVVPIVDVIFEHRIYLPSWGIIASVVSGVSLLLEKSRLHSDVRRHMIFAVISLILLCQALLLLHRNEIWAAKISLMSDVAAKSPGKPRAHLGLGHAYDEAGMYAEAVEEYKTALTLPFDEITKDVDVLKNLGSVLIQAGRAEEAVDVLLRATRIDPSNVDILNNLSIGYLDLGLTDQAISYAELALMLRPDSGRIRNTIGEIYYRQNRCDQALSEFMKAAELDPDIPDRYLNIGLCMKCLGKTEEAAAYFRKYYSLSTSINSQNFP